MGLHYREPLQSEIWGGNGFPFGAQRCLPWKHLLFKGDPKSYSRTTGIHHPLNVDFLSLKKKKITNYLVAYIEVAGRNWVRCEAGVYRAIALTRY